MKAVFKKFKTAMRGGFKKFSLAERAAFKDFRFARRASNLNLSLQIILGLLLFFMLNFMAARYYTQYDLSDGKKNSLSLESLAYVKDLSEPLDIYVTVNKGIGEIDVKQVQSDLTKLMSQYEYASRGNAKAQIDVSFINPNMESKKLEEVVMRFGKNIENTVIIATKDKKYKVLSLPELYDLSSQENITFKGEQVVSSAILAVSSSDTPKLYFLKGHGEMSPTSTDPLKGLSEFSTYLKARNYDIAILDIIETDKIPEDADMIIIAGSQVSFLPREINLLKDYLWKRNGRLMVLLSMGATNSLDSIFLDWGIKASISSIDEDMGVNESVGGDIIVKRFSENSHKIVDILYKLDLPLQFGSTRMVRQKTQEEGLPLDQSIALNTLLFSSENSWVKNDWAKDVASGRAIQGPLPLAMLASRTGNNDLGISIPGGKLIVFGDEDFASNRLFGRLGNSTLLSNTLNWMFERDSLLDIQSKPMDKYILTLSENDIISLLIRFLLLPAFIAVFGLLVLFLRR